ncbi:MAG: hypothetical protein JXB48_11100 [Candidatus Latescibacteria bacterium]|nr:hypothetical protein [Candidatus Latescibacterota bacterium]
MPLRFLFPIESVYNASVPAYIHYNGNIIRFFSFTEFDPDNVGKCLSSTPDGSSFQIFRYHTPGNDRYFLSLCGSVEYGNSIPVTLFRKFSFNPLIKESEALHKRIGRTYSLLSKLVDNQPLKETDYLRSELPQLLYDHDSNGNTIKASPVRTNMSYCKIGHNRYATMASINNVSRIPPLRDILTDFEYLERIVVVFPSVQRQKELQSHILDNAVLIDYLARNNETEISVDTICKDAGSFLPRFGRVAYCDVTFFLSSGTVNSLSTDFHNFYTVMHDHDLALYCHTNTTRSTYISLFPGNDSFGERYSLVFENTLPEIINNSFGL